MDLSWRRASLISVMTLLNSLAVFGCQWIVVTRLGAGPHTDAFFSASVAPTLLANVIVASLAYVLVPVFAVSRADSRDDLVWTIGIAVTLALLGISAILWLTANLWVPLLAPGFSEDEIVLTRGLARIQLASVTLNGTSTVLAAAYSSQNKFVFPAVANVIASALALIGVATTIASSGVFGAAWATACRPLFLTVLLIAFTDLPKPRWSSSGLGETLRRLVPLVLGSAYYKTDQLVDRLLASLAPAGTLSQLHLAQQMYAAANQTLIASVAAPPVPRLAALAATRSPQFSTDVVRLLARLLGIGFVVYALVIYPGNMVLNFLFARGNLRSDQVQNLWLIMVAFGLAWFAGLAGQVLSSAFYAMGDTSTPTRIGSIGFTVGVLLKIAAFKAYGVIGIAIATGVYSAANSVAMGLVLLRRRDQGRPTDVF